nr:MAG TPA: hypothetical protein [Caudoviricetes sp.]
MEIEPPRCGNIGGFRFEVELYGLLVSILSNDIISYVKFVCNILCNKISSHHKFSTTDHRIDSLLPLQLLGRTLLY